MVEWQVDWTEFKRVLHAKIRRQVVDRKYHQIDPRSIDFFLAHLCFCDTLFVRSQTQTDKTLCQIHVHARHHSHIENNSNNVFLPMYVRFFAVQSDTPFVDHHSGRMRKGVGMVITSGCNGDDVEVSVYGVYRLPRI